MDLTPELIDLTSSHLTEYGFVLLDDAEGSPPEADHYRVGHAVTNHVFDVLAMPDLSPASLAYLPPETILAVPFMTPAAMRYIELAGGAGFIDSSGNAHIEAPGIFVDVRGRAQSPLARQARRHLSSGWNSRPGGLKIVFTLLTRPGALTLTLTDLAHASGSSVATAHRTVNDLADQGLIDGSGKTRAWVDPRSALTAWLEGYRHRLGPRVPETRLVLDYGPDDWAAATDEGSVASLLTSDAALMKLGAPLRAVSTTLYSATIPRIRDARLRRPRVGETANLVIRTPWWPPENQAETVVPPILVHADALLSGDPRIIAVAEQFFGGVDGLAATVA